MYRKPTENITKLQLNRTSHEKSVVFIHSLHIWCGFILLFLSVSTNKTLKKKKKESKNGQFHKVKNIN